MENAWVKRSGTRLAVVVAAAVLLMLLLAVPAMAAPFATSLVASPSHSTVGAGDGLTISAVLTDTDNALPISGDVVRVEQAASGAGPWTLINYADNEGAAGNYSLEVFPEEPTYYRFVFLATETYAAATSNVLSVGITGVGPFATSLVASPTQTTVNVGDNLTISAVLTDTANVAPVGGELVRVEQAANSSGPWSLSQLATTDVTTGVASYDFVPAQTAYYRFVYGGGATYLSSTSNVISVVVTPLATGLTASPSQTTLNHGDSLTISAVLTETAAALPLGGATLRVESATSTGGPWALVQTVTNNGATGNYTLAVQPPLTTYYRFVYEGTGTYAAVTSNTLTVTVTPAATSLTASPGQQMVTAGSSPTISAVLTQTSGALPIAGASLRVEQSTSSSGPWSLVQTVTNGGANGNYSLAVQPPLTTYYRFVYEGTSSYAAVTSNTLTVTVTPAATSLTASPGQQMVTAGSSPTISAVLTQTSGALPIAGASLRVEQSTSSSGPWSLVQTVTNGGANGNYSLAVQPSRTTYYRFVYEGTEAHAAVTSDFLTITVKPVLKTPTCPSSIKKSKTFKVKGTVSPGAPSGPAVKIQAYRKHDGKWSKYKSAFSTSRSGINYSASIKIKDAGQYKFKATVAPSAAYVAVTSAYTRVLTVKK